MSYKIISEKSSESSMLKLNPSTLINFTDITWDNGTELGISGGRTLYFNGLSREITADGLKIKAPNGLDWHQTFGFDSCQGNNGELLDFHLGLVEIGLTGKIDGDFFKIELLTNTKQFMQFWVKHPDRNQIGVKKTDNSLIFGMGEITVSKLQFSGQLNLLDITLTTLKQKDFEYEKN